MFSRQAVRSLRAAAPASRLVAARVPAVRTYAAAASSAASDNVKPPSPSLALTAPTPLPWYAPVPLRDFPGYTAAAKTSSLDPTAKALSTLEAIFAKDPKLATVLAAPTLTPEDKDAIVAELTKQAGASSQETVKNFLAALAENNRLGLLPGITHKFAEIMSAARGEVELVVTSATTRRWGPFHPMYTRNRASCWESDKARDCLVCQHPALEGPSTARHDEAIFGEGYMQLDNKTLNRLETAISKSAYAGAGKKLKVTNQVNPDIVGGLIVEIGDRTIDLSVSGKIAKLNKLLTDTL
ncbi:ATP synthase subunit 5 [Colletotrichum tofieldiae]|nr:ATP synthase subunit 5 [Colletotrichum tofieldiae]